MDDETGISPARRKRSVALALVLGGLVLLIFVMSIVKWVELVPQ